MLSFRFKVEGDDVLYDSPSNDKIIIYLKKVNNQYMKSSKAFGTHYLEQTLDAHNNIVSEVIKENPHKVKLDRSLFDRDYL